MMGNRSCFFFVCQFFLYQLFQILTSVSTSLVPDQADILKSNFQIILKVSNSLDQNQADILSGLIWVQNVCKGYQQTTPAGKELKCNPGFVPDILKFRLYFEQ